MKPKVLICVNIPEHVKKFLNTFCSAEFCDLKKMHRSELLKKLEKAEGVMLFGTRVDDEFFENAPKLKAVCNVSVGYNNVNLEAARKGGIVITNTPDVLNETVADLVFGLILAVSRRTSELDLYVKSGSWKRSDVEVLYGRDVHHATIGIIGMGRIGEAVARRAAGGFSMRVLYCNRNRKPETEKKLGAVYCEMNTLLSESDFVVVMTPLTEETFKMIGEKELSIMKKSAVLINASRGKVIDEKALINALESGQIAGAGLDVFDTEPVPNDNPLLKLDNVILLPHIGSATHKTRGDMAMLAAENLRAVLQGEKALTPVI